jgi:hypothetical protein
MIGTDVHTNIARKKVTHPAAPLVLIPRISWAKDLSDGAKPVMCQAPPRIVISEHYGGSDHEVRCAVCSRWPAPDDHVWRPKFGQPSDGVQRVRDAPKSTIARPPSCPGRKAEIIAGTCSRILLLTPKVTGRPHMVTATTRVWCTRDAFSTAESSPSCCPSRSKLWRSPASPQPHLSQQVQAIQPTATTARSTEAASAAASAMPAAASSALWPSVALVPRSQDVLNPRSRKASLSRRFHPQYFVTITGVT